MEAEKKAREAALLHAEAEKMAAEVAESAAVATDTAKVVAVAAVATATVTVAAAARAGVPRQPPTHRLDLRGEQTSAQGSRSRSSPRRLPSNNWKSNGFPKGIVYSCNMTAYFKEHEAGSTSTALCTTRRPSSTVIMDMLGTGSYLLGTTWKT